MADPSVEERLQRLNKALGPATLLADDTPAHWENDCEGIFSEFRVSCVHLRREREALDSVEDKVGAWRFIVKFCKARPFLHDRCNEVLRILMQSDLWMKTFAENPDLSIEDLPETIAEDFEKRAKEAERDESGASGRSEPVRGQRPASQRCRSSGSRPCLLGLAAGVALLVTTATPEPADGRPGREKGAPQPPDRGPTEASISGPSISIATRPANMAVVVQRCSKARVLVDERAQWWGEIGPGLVISVSFSKGAKEDAVRHAARFMLTAKLSSKDRWEPGSSRGPGPRIGGDAEAVATLCKQGEEQGVLVMPQASLCSELGKDNIGLQYDHLCPQATAATLYKQFVEALRTAAVELVGKAQRTKAPVLPAAPDSLRGAQELKIVSANFHGPQYMEMTSSGPFMHAFNF